ncbi:MAG: transcription/translation regulatory transformer protein RfaH [Pseudohongiella sp.]|nr:transcription/translation regulatory transformer protein RfaH [Pseudohongiella sp.]
MKIFTENNTAQSLFVSGLNSQQFVPSMQKQWYVIYAKPRQEEVAKLHLERQSFEVYLPRLEVTKRCKSELVATVEPFFPRYLFIHLDLQAEDWSPIRSTRGVCGLVRFDGVPKSVPSAFIQYLIQSENSQQLQSIDRKPWKAGDKVEIEQGPFSGYSCIFQGQRSADRVTVLLNIVGKQTRTTILKQDLKLPQYA